MDREGLTQATCAQKAELSTATISHILNDKHVGENARERVENMLSRSNGVSVEAESVDEEEKYDDPTKWDFTSTAMFEYMIEVAAQNDCLRLLAIETAKQQSAGEPFDFYGPEPDRSSVREQLVALMNATPEQDTRYRLLFGLYAFVGAEPLT